MSPPLIREPLRLPLAFFVSGAAALLFEVLWFRALGRVLGNTVWAGTLVLTAFMLGIALGGILAARWAERVRRPALAFAAAEVTVALSGGLLVWGMPGAEPLIGGWLAPLSGHSTALSASRLVLALAAMLVPTTAMGTTLALGVRLLWHRDTARALGALYAANTFGACLAPLLAEYYLIGVLGLSGTACIAAALDLIAAGLALMRNQDSAVARTSARVDSSPVRLLAAAALAGALALALEVIWFRLLLLHAPATDTSFALMLTLLLAGIASGSALAPLLARLRFAWVSAGCSLAVVLGYALALPGPSGSTEIIRYAMPLMLPAAALSGALFTLLGAELRAGSENPQAPIGRLVSANTLGGACGAALAGLVLLPRFGIESSLLFLAAGYALMPLLFVERPAPWKPMLAAALGALALLLFPMGNIQVHLAQAARTWTSLEGSSVVEVQQGPTTTLQLLRREFLGESVSWRLLTDNYSMTATDLWALRYMQLFAWLPLSLHPAPRRALLISYGAGNTALAILGEPELKTLTVVDVSPEILAASRTIHGAEDPLLDQRVRVVLEDGRHYLRTRSEHFDLITGEPPPPAMAGVVNLYTREYFAALAARLAPGGLASYWLPVNQLEPRGARAVIAAFCEAFPDCSLWTGSSYQWILLGGREFHARPSFARFARLWHDEARATRLAASAFEHPEQVGATFLADATQLTSWYGGTAALDDDHPKRIAADISARKNLYDYDQWLVPDGARRRFESSTWVAAHWPAELIGGSGPYFFVQPIINGGFDIDPINNLRHVDELLKKTDLRVPLLWMLGSSIPEQQIVDRRLPGTDIEQRFRFTYAYAIGVRALADRSYTEAAALFVRAAEHDPRQAGPLAAYAWCRAGLAKRAARIPGAERLAPELRCWTPR